MIRSISIVIASAAALLSLLAARACAEERGFLTVPPVWAPSAGVSERPSITARAFCELSADLRATLPAQAIACGASVRSGLARPGDLAKAMAASVRGLKALDEYCAAEPAKSACAALFVRSGPFELAGREKIAAIADDTEDRDLDGAQRATPDDKVGTSANLSAEGRFVEGLTNFVLDRAKLEAITYFEERFHSTLCQGDPATPRVSYFLSVCNVLSNAQRAGFSLAAASRELRAAARRDLRALPDGALHQQYFDTGQPIFPTMRIWLGLASRLRDHTLAPANVFAALSSVNPAVCGADQRWMRAHDGVQPDAAEAAEECNRALRTFAIAGAVLDIGVRLGAGDPKTEELVDAAWLAFRVGSESWDEYTESFSVQFVTAVTAIDQLNPPQGNPTAKPLLQRFRDTANDVEKLAEEARKLQGLERNQKMRLLATRLLELADNMLNLADAAALALAGCTDDICGLDGEQLRQQVALGTRAARLNARLTREVLEDRWTVVAVEISRLFLTADRRGKALALAGQYAPVIAEVAGAKSTVEVQKVLSDAAAPAGTHREKFRGNTRSISALVGLGAGREWYDTSEGSSSGKFYGLFAPVGIHVTTPIPDDGDNGYKYFFGGAIGAFVSILDLGPYAAYRSGAEGVEKQASVGLKQVLSPGIYFTRNVSVKGWGWFERSPWVVGFGVARTTALYENNQGRDVSSTRLQAFLAIDVTLFPF